MYGIPTVTYFERICNFRIGVAYNISVKLLTLAKNMKTIAMEELTLSLYFPHTHIVVVKLNLLGYCFSPEGDVWTITNYSAAL